MYFGKLNLGPLLLTFAQLHPDGHLNIDFSDRFVDVINEHHDLVVRVSELQDSSLIAPQLCQTCHVFCASPDYIKSHGPLDKPEDVKDYRIIQFGGSKRPKWEFSAPSGKKLTMSVNASMSSFDGEFLIDAAEQGLGIIRVPDFLAQSSLDSGKLVQLLQCYCLKPRGIYVVYSTARYLPDRTRVLMEYILENATRKNDGKCAT